MVQVWNINEVSQMESELVEIWQEAFNDSKEVIRAFMQKVSCETKVITYRVNGEIVSSAYLLPVSYVKDDSTSMSCYYLYAAATRTDYRGRGYFAHILQFVNKCIDKPVILVPASEGLVAYYKGQGFYMWLSESQDSSIKLKKQKATTVSKEEYIRFRKEVFSRPGSVWWDDKMLSYILSEHEKAGGIFAETFLEESRVLFMCIETALDRHILEVVSHNARFRIQPTVMANKTLFEKEKGYFNLTMG